MGSLAKSNKYLRQKLADLENKLIEKDKNIEKLQLANLELTSKNKKQMADIGKLERQRAMELKSQAISMQNAHLE